MRKANATWKAQWRGWVVITLPFAFLVSLLVMASSADERGADAGVLHSMSHGVAVATYFLFPLLPLLLLGTRPDDRWRPPGHRHGAERSCRPDRWRLWMAIVAIEIPLLLAWGFLGASHGEYIFSGAYLPCGKHLPSEPLRTVLFVVAVASFFLMPVALILGYWARRGTPSAVARSRRRSAISSS